jgi:hypothetical protein
VGGLCEGLVLCMEVRVRQQKGRGGLFLGGRRDKAGGDVMSCHAFWRGGGRGVFFFFLRKGKGLNFAIFDIWLLRVASRQGFDLAPRRSLS